MERFVCHFLGGLNTGTVTLTTFRIRDSFLLDHHHVVALCFTDSGVERYDDGKNVQLPRYGYLAFISVIVKAVFLYVIYLWSSVFRQSCPSQPESGLHRRRTLRDLH